MKQLDLLNNLDAGNTNNRAPGNKKTPVVSVGEGAAVAVPPQAVASVKFAQRSSSGAGGLESIPEHPIFSAIENHATLPPDTWMTEPNRAFEDWQRNTISSDGMPYAPKSIDQHCAMFRRFADYMATNGFAIQTITAGEIGVFLEKLTTRDGKPAIDSTKQRYLKLLRATFEHLRKIRYRTTPNPCGLLSRFNRRELDVAPSSLATSENDAFVEIVLAKEPESWRDCRDQAMLLLIIASGLKASEVIHLQTTDLMLGEDPPFIRIPAHGKVPERVTPISEFALAPLHDWLALRRQMKLDADNTVFVSTLGGPMRPETLHRKCKAILGSYGNDLHPRGGFGPQVLRNAFLARQLANDKPLEVVQQWAGHVETKSTARFQRLVVNPNGVKVS